MNAGREAECGNRSNKTVLKIKYINHITFYKAYLGNTQEADITCHRKACRYASKVNINQLLGVESTVIIGCFRNRGGDIYSSSINCLPSVIAVYTTSNFLDEDRSKTLAANFLMDTKEIHLE